MPVENVRHQGETFPRQVVAQVRSGTPLTVDIGRRVNGFRTVNGAGVHVDLVGGGKLLPGTSAPIAHPRPARLDIFVDGLGRVHGRYHLDGAAGTGHRYGCRGEIIHR